MAQTPRQYEDDDGRVICDMNVEGMRWREPRSSRDGAPRPHAPSGDTLTRSEARRFTWNALLAGLLIATVFSAAWVLFILFCVLIWFR